MPRRSCDRSCSASKCATASDSVAPGKSRAATLARRSRTSAWIFMLVTVILTAYQPGYMWGYVRDPLAAGPRPGVLGNNRHARFLHPQSATPDLPLVRSMQMDRADS